MDSEDAIKKIQEATGEIPEAPPQYDHFSVSRQDFETFCGKNAKKFLAVHDKVNSIENKNNVASWCWPAFLTGFAWFMYRKMYLYAAILFLAPIAFFLIFPDMEFGAGAIAVVLGLMGKFMYLQWAERRISAINETPGLTEEDRAEKIRNAGGVSVLGGILGGVLFAAVLGLAVLGMIAETAQ